MKESNLISNDERREVAARLRENADSGLYDERNAVALIGMVLFATNATVEDTTESIMRRLANLIEPEPERTCTMRYYPASNLWRCSECVGATHAGGTLDEPPVYCQWCGSRVIE